MPLAAQTYPGNFSVQASISAATDPHEVAHVEQLDFEPVPFGLVFFAPGLRFQVPHLPDELFDRIGQLVGLDFNGFKISDEFVHISDLLSDLRDLREALDDGGGGLCVSHLQGMQCCGVAVPRQVKA